MVNKVNGLKNNIRLIATDIDGTWLNDAVKMSKYNLDFIKQLAADEINVVLVTSQPLEMLLSDVLTSGHIKYSITSNGAVVYDHLNDVIIENNVLAKDDAIILLEHVRKTKPVLTVATDEGIMTDRSTFANIVSSSAEEHAKIIKIFEDNRPVYDRVQFDDNIKASVEKVHLNYANLEDKDKAVAYLSSIYTNDEHHITSSHFSNVEITHRDATKYAAVLRIAQELNIDSNSVLTIGDGQNDLGMFEVSSHSVAMVNGHADVKAKANYVTEVDNDNSGWSKFIKDYIYY